MSIRMNHRRTAAAAMGITMIAALAACSDDGDDDAQETVTFTETAAPDSDSGSAGDSTDSADSSEGASSSESNSGGSGSNGGGTTGGSVESLEFNNDDVASQFTNVQCQADDDGDPDDAGEYSISLLDDNRNEIELDLNTEGDPIVEGLSVEIDGKEWDGNDRQERDATVEVNGDTYTVSGQVEVDDDDPDAGQTADLKAEVNCS